MHPNPVFHTETDARNVAFARDRGFGLLAVNGEDGPLMAHVPFLLNKDGTHLDLHLVRSNPIVRDLKNGTLKARLAVHGPDSYVSPDWYEVEDQVPTWNYVAVHLWGDLQLEPDMDMRALLDRQSAMFETKLMPKTPWTTDKMTPEVRDRMMRQIVACSMEVSKIDGTWKLNQNKPDDVRMRAASGVETYGQGQELGWLAALMRGASRR